MKWPRLPVNYARIMLITTKTQTEESLITDLMLQNRRAFLKRIQHHQSTKTDLKMKQLQTRFHLAVIILQVKILENLNFAIATACVIVTACVNKFDERLLL